MGKILKFPSLDQYLAGIKSSGGIINDKIIKHYEVEKMAAQFDVFTTIELVNCDLPKSCAVVKAIAKHQGCSYESFGEVSPLNNDFEYPVVRIFQYIQSFKSQQKIVLPPRHKSVDSSDRSSRNHSVCPCMCEFFRETLCSVSTSSI